MSSNLRPVSPISGSKSAPSLFMIVTNDTADVTDDLAPPRYRTYKRRWFGLVILMLLNIVVSWCWLTFAPVSNITAEWFSQSSQGPVNWLSTVFLFAYTVATPAVIYLLAKYDLKKPLIFSSALLLVGNWMRYAGTVKKLFPLLMTGQIVIGMSQPFVLACPTHFSNLWFSSRSRVSATALVSLASPVGAAVGNLVNPALATDASQIPFMVLVVAIISTGTAVSVFLIPAHPPTPISAANKTQHPALGASLRLLFKNTQFLLILAEFTAYVALFNSFSTLLNQLMLPRGYTADTAGFTGALLIVVGLIFSAILSPVIGRTHSFLLAVRLLVPLIAVCYVGFIFAPHHGLLAPPFVVASVLGAASFSLLPCALELAAEMTYPVTPEWSGNVMWAGGQFGGAILIIVGGQLKTGPKDDMMWALVLMAALAVAVAPGVLFIGRRGRLQLARLTAEKDTNGESVGLSSRNANR